MHSLRWYQMDEEQRRVTLHSMARFGGGFVSRLAEAWQVADERNAARLGAEFDDLIVRYGPGSSCYAEAARREGVAA